MKSGTDQIFEGDPTSPKFPASVVLSKKLLAEMQLRLKNRTDFGLEDAYTIYDSIVNGRLAKSNDKTWRHMNVRNQLCRMVYDGILVRIRRGLYTFVK